MSRKNEPAFFVKRHNRYGDEMISLGLTKLEYASLEILKGLMLRHKESGYLDIDAINESIRLAEKFIKAISEKENNNE